MGLSRNNQLIITGKHIQGERTIALHCHRLLGFCTGNGDSCVNTRE
jgi:hypothetical protein